VQALREFGGGHWNHRGTKNKLRYDKVSGRGVKKPFKAGPMTQATHQYNNGAHGKVEGGLRMLAQTRDGGQRLKTTYIAKRHRKEGGAVMEFADKGRVTLFRREQQAAGEVKKGDRGL